MRSAGSASAVVALSLAVLFILPGPASAYLVQSGGFADQSDVSTVVFDGSISPLQGASLRLQLNSTVTAASLVVRGDEVLANTSVTETSTAEFASYSALENITLGTGNLSLRRAGGVIIGNVSNSFRNATLTSLMTANGSLALSAATTGSFETEVLAAPPAGWGAFSTFADISAGGSVAFDLLTPGGSVLASNITPGVPLAVDSAANPQLRVRGTLSAPSPEASPHVVSFTLGQSIGDSFVGSGVQRSFTGGRPADGGGVSPDVNFASLMRHPANPIFTATPSTFYSGSIHSFQVMKAGSQWFAYFIGNTTYSADGNVGFASSPDLNSWTFLPYAVLNATGGTWDGAGLEDPYVMEDPSGSGYLMYYSAMNGPGAGIGLATSPDGINWTKSGSNPILVPSASGWDNYAVLVYQVAYNATSGIWTMWFLGRMAGNDRSIGVATSTDGVNWTKYASNPVLAPTPGGPDSGLVGDGGFVEYRGAMYFYYTCNSPAGYKVCLATSTDGGYTFSKQGALLSTNGGFEALSVTAPWPLIVNGSLIVYYSGFGGGTISIGRTDAAFVQTTVTGRFDFGANPPAVLTRANFTAVRPSGSQTVVELRSSSTGSTWTSYENITAMPAALTTPAARFVEWRVTMNASVRSSPPIFRQISVDFESYLAHGRYESSSFGVVGRVVSIALSSQSTLSGGSADFEVSADDGVSWAPVVGPGPVTPAAAAGAVRYAVTLYGLTYATPVIDSVSLLIVRAGYPANVTVRLGSAGPEVFNTTGRLDSALNVSLDPAVLNGLIEAYRTQFPNAAQADIPLYVASSSFGSVTLREPRVSFVLKNPLQVTFAPDTGTPVAMDEGTNFSASLTYASYPPEVPVNVSWWVDGVEAVASRGHGSFEFAAAFDSAGNHLVRAFVENGDYFFNGTWNLTVRDVNRPPVLTDASPAWTTGNFSHTVRLDFAANATDPDGTVPTRQWYVDGAYIPGASAAPFGLQGAAPGAHQVAVAFTDASFVVWRNWSFVLTDAGPAAEFSPAGDVVMSHAAQTKFTINATDLDGDALSFSWWLDGDPLTGVQSNYTLKQPPTGSHTLNASVSSSGGFQNYSWDIVSTNEAPSITSFTPASPVALKADESGVFSAVVSDPDDGVLHYAWSIDGVSVAEPTSTYVQPSGLSPGPHVVRMTVSDPDGANATNLWTVQVSAPPLITSSGPGFELYALLALIAAAVIVAFLVLRRRRESPPGGDP